MLEYILLYLLLGMGILMEDMLDKKSNGLWYTTFIYLTLLIGFRYKVGGDTYNYMYFYEYSPDIYDWEIFNYALFEPGFTFLAAIVKTFSESFYTFQVVHVLILNIFLFKYINRETPYRFTALFLSVYFFYFIFSTEVLREAFSILIFLYSYHYIEEKKYIRYIIMVLIALLFHTGAVFLFCIPFCKKINIRNTLVIILFFVPFALIFSAKLFQILEAYPLFEKVARYSDIDNVGYFWMGSRLIYYGFLPLTILYYFKTQEEKEVKNEYLICTMAIISMGIIINPIIFARFVNYFLPIYTVQLANLFVPKLREPNSISRIVVSLLFCMVLLTYTPHYWHGAYYKIWVPYHSIVDEVEEAERMDFVPN